MDGDGVVGKDMEATDRNRRGRRAPGNAAAWLACVLLLWAGAAGAAAPVDRVEIADPYIELRTGPGRGYPIFHVEERGAAIALLTRKTGWFKVRTARDIEGWVDRAQLERTLNPSGGAVRVRDGSFGDFVERRWEFGVQGGEFGRAGTISAYAMRAFGASLHGEISVAHVLGKFSDSLIVSAGLLAQPVPEWRVSPFFLLGTGVIDTSSHSVLVQTRDGRDQLSHVGVGLRTYVSRRILLRAEYRYHVIFTSRDDNEEVSEWKAGFSVFF